MKDDTDLIPDDHRLIVLLGHKARVGKDTLANELGVHDGFIRFAFADKLKEVTMDLFNLDTEQVYGDEKEVPDERYPNVFDKHLFHRNKEEFYTGRRILQILGQQLRAIDPDIWCKYVYDRITTSVAIGESNKFVITDFRFPNEAELFLKLARRDPTVHVILVRIDRDDASTISGAEDISEKALECYSRWDFILKNSGSPAWLRVMFLENLKKVI